MNDKYYKKYIEKLIEDNPTEIIIKRKIKTDDGYGGTKEKEIEVTETVTFYDRKSRREILTDYGKTYTGVNITKILTKGDVEIYKDEKFTVDGTEYKVFYVKPYKDICKQVELEVVKWQ